jgi:hypothetical protein
LAKGSEALQRSHLTSTAPKKKHTEVKADEKVKSHLVHINP